MIMEYSIYEILWLFFIYGFIGWCMEVAYCGLEEGKFVNRGFLNGPICPIYGVGAVTVILCLTPIKENILLLFVCSIVLTSVLELITGFALDKIFHARWWDYSDLPFNIGGYICLKFSILWGFVCIALMKGIHPLIDKAVNVIPHIVGIVVLIFFLVIFITDMVITVVTINKLTNRIKLMDEIAKKIHDFSDEVGEHIYDGVSVVVKKSEEFRKREDVQHIKEKYVDSIEALRIKNENNIEELKQKYANVLKEKHTFQKRILNAFPNMKSRKYEEQLEKLKEKIKNKKILK